MVKAQATTSGATLSISQHSTESTTLTRSIRVATMRAAGLFVAISSVQALAPTAKRRDIGAFLGGAALTTLAPRPALADVKIDPNSVRTTKGGAKYVVVKEGSCPLIDPSGALGSCYPVRESTSASDASLSHFPAMPRPCWLRRAVRNRHHHAIEQASRRWRGG